MLFALFRQKPKNRIEGLVETLWHKDDKVRSQAVEALAQIGEPAISVLLAALSKDDRNDELRHFENPLLRTALVRIGEPALKALIEALLYSPELGRAAAKTLANFKDDRAIEALITALGKKDLDTNTRCYAAESLGLSKDSRAFEPLLLALTDENEFVVANAARALAAYHDPLAIQPILVALRQPHVYHSHARWEINRALADLGFDIGYI
jgi:HEAT repeat protein